MQSKALNLCCVLLTRCLVLKHIFPYSLFSREYGKIFCRDYVGSTFPHTLALSQDTLRLPGAAPLRLPLDLQLFREVRTSVSPQCLCIDLDAIVITLITTVTIITIITAVVV